jgi:hypothetical protein
MGRRRGVADKRVQRDDCVPLAALQGVGGADRNGFGFQGFRMARRPDVWALRATTTQMSEAPSVRASSWPSTVSTSPAPIRSAA